MHLIRHGQGFHNVYGEADEEAYKSNKYMDAHLTELGWHQVCHSSLFSEQNMLWLHFRARGPRAMYMESQTERGLASPVVIHWSRLNTQP